MTDNNNNNNDGGNGIPLSTADIRQQVHIRMLTKSGPGARPPTTVMQTFDAMVGKHGNRPALFQKVHTKDTQYTSWTWNEYSQQVNAFAKSLIHLKFERFDVINILGFNSPEWFFANFGAIAAGGVPAGIYATNSSEACFYITQHSQAKIVVCEGIKQLEKYYETAKSLPNLQALVVYGSDPLPADIAARCPAVPVYAFADFLKLGSDVSDETLQARRNDWKPGHVCTLIYTSGTTGPPKGVMITNDNITWTVSVMLLTTPRQSLNENDRIVSYLPLSHIAAQMLDMHMPMYTGCQTYFAQPDALKGSLVVTLKDVRPTVFFGVPRVYEKFYEKMQEVAKTTTGIKKMLSTWAKGQALTYWTSRQYGQSPQNPFLFGLARKLLHKVHIALGFDQCHAFYVSAAPIEVKILNYFASLDLPIMELFGQSECTGPHAVNAVKTAFKIGTVGRPIKGTETKRDPDTGELCYRGRHIFAGYMGMPAETAETIDTDGWLHSGDVVHIDDDTDPDLPGTAGFISITGRIKELIITAGGENVPPVLIEDELKAAMPALSNAMVIGDKRKFLSVLLCVQVELDDDGNPTNRLAGHALDTCKEIGSTAKTTEEVRSDPAWQAYFNKGLAAANAKATSRAQNVSKWTLLKTDFSEHGTELTPTLKLKRSVAAEKYAAEIEAMYV